MASAKALVSQTRVLINQCYKESNFYTEYQNKVKDLFVNNILVKFIEDLRNYCLHYALPFTNASFRIYSNELEREKINRIEFSFSLNKQGLLSWEKWTKDAKLYLSNADEEIIIEDLIDEYYQLVEKFHQWMNIRLQEIHSDDFAWLEKKEKKLEI